MLGDEVVSTPSRLIKRHEEEQIGLSPFSKFVDENHLMCAKGEKTQEAEKQGSEKQEAEKQGSEKIAVREKPRDGRTPTLGSKIMQRSILPIFYCQI